MKKYQNVRAHQISVTSGARALSSRLGVASIAMTGINVVATGQLKASDVLYSSMAAISFTGFGSVVAGSFFLADFGVMGASYMVTGNATSIGDYLDQSTNGGVILNSNDFK